MKTPALVLSALFVSVLSIARADASCAPIDGKISFAGFSNYSDDANLIGGDVPRLGWQVGSIYMSNSEFGGIWQGFGADANLSLNIGAGFPASMKPYPSYPAGAANPFGPFGRPQDVNLSGYLSLRPAALEKLRGALRSGELRVPGVDPSRAELRDVCVSEVAVNLGKPRVGTTFRGGSVFLYLNDTNQAFEARF